MSNKETQTAPQPPQLVIPVEDPSDSGMRLTPVPSCSLVAPAEQLYARSQACLRCGATAQR